MIRATTPIIEFIIPEVSSCYNLKSIIDISSLNLGNGTGVLTTVASMFANCWAIKKIIFKNVNLESCTTVSAIFSYCKSLQEIEWDNITPITDVCTTCTSMFSYCYSLTELPTDFAGWDFSKASVLTMFYYSWNLKRIEVSHTAIPSTLTMADGSSAKILGYMYGLEYCDIEYLFTDYSQFSSTYAHSTYVESSWTKLKTFKTPGGLCKATTANSPVLSKELILEIFDRLVDRTGTTALKLTIGSVNLTKLSDAEKAIATSKNWTLA